MVRDHLPRVLAMHLKGEHTVAMRQPRVVHNDSNADFVPSENKLPKPGKDRIQSHNEQQTLRPTAPTGHKQSPRNQ